MYIHTVPSRTRRGAQSGPSGFIVSLIACARGLVRNKPRMPGLVAAVAVLVAVRIGVEMLLILMRAASIVFAHRFGSVSVGHGSSLVVVVVVARVVAFAHVVVGAQLSSGQSATESPPAPSLRRTRTV